MLKIEWQYTSNTTEIVVLWYNYTYNSKFSPCFSPYISLPDSLFLEPLDRSIQGDHSYTW